MGSMTDVVRAREDRRLSARVVARRPLRYAEGADVALDRPAHVRAGSGLAWVGRGDGRGDAPRLAVVQDDANFLAIVDLSDRERPAARALTLPAGAGGARQFDEARGTKRWKLDLEACLTLVDASGAEVLLGLGSGSTAERERVLVARGLDPRWGEVAATLVAAPALYELLRRPDLAGAELNIEGAAAQGGDVVLFQRGNGAPRRGLAAVDATARLDARTLLAHLEDPSVRPPPVRDVTPYDLGALEGVRLTFTDGAAGPGGALWFLAAAEASPDAYRDGPVTGAVLGVLEPGGARWACLEEGDGPLLGKAEGLALDPRDPTRAFVVLDLDDPTVPSDLCEVRLGGPWT
jgi:hypothetical protein